MKKLIIATACFFVANITFAQSEQDKKDVMKAVENYMNAFYEADTSKAYESIAKDLAKRGYYTYKDTVRYATMSFDQLIRLAKRWKSTKTITESTPRKITVFDVLGKIASAKLEADWGVDYFHLAQIDGKWIIINVLWQDYITKD